MFKKIISKDSLIYKIYKEADLLVDRIEHHHIFMLASGIAFNILLYLLPLFLVAVYVVNLIFNIGDLSATMQEILRDLLPPTDSTNALLKKVVEEVDILMTNSSLFGYIGFGILLWISSTLISSLRTGLNVIFEIPSPRVFVFYKLKDISLTIILTILVLFYSYAVPVILIGLTFVQKYVPAELDWLVSGGIVMTLSLLTSSMLFYFIFRSVPNEKLPRSIRLIATGGSVVLIEISRHLFAWYLGTISNYGRFYGTYAVIVSMAIWIYYSSLIILLSAEFGKFLHDRRNAKWQLEEPDQETT